MEIVWETEPPAQQVATSDTPRPQEFAARLKIPLLDKVGVFFEKHGLNFLPPSIPRLIRAIEAYRTKKDNGLRLNTLRWQRGRDFLVTSINTQARSLGDRYFPAQIVINETFLHAFSIEKCPFLKSIETGNFEAEYLGEGLSNVAFKTSINEQEYVVRYPKKLPIKGKYEPFIANGIDAYITLRAIREYTNIRTVEPVMATRSVLVCSFQEGAALDQYFCKKYGDDWYEKTEYQSDPHCAVWRQAQESISAAVSKAKKEGRFDVLNLPVVPEMQLDLSAGNFIIDPNSNELVLIDPVSSG